jgi:hypothetical protein
LARIVPYHQIDDKEASIINDIGKCASVRKILTVSSYFPIERVQNCHYSLFALASAASGGFCILMGPRPLKRLRSGLQARGHSPHSGDYVYGSDGAESLLSVVPTISLLGIISFRMVACPGSVAGPWSIVAYPGSRSGVPTLGALMTWRSQSPGWPSSWVVLSHSQS